MWFVNESTAVISPNQYDHRYFTVCYRVGFAFPTVAPSLSCSTWQPSSRDEPGSEKTSFPTADKSESCDFNAEHKHFSATGFLTIHFICFELCGTDRALTTCSFVTAPVFLDASAAAPPGLCWRWDWSRAPSRRSSCTQTEGPKATGRQRQTPEITSSTCGSTSSVAET